MPKTNEPWTTVSSEGDMLALLRSACQHVQAFERSTDLARDLAAPSMMQALGSAGVSALHRTALGLGDRQVRSILLPRVIRELTVAAAPATTRQTIDPQKWTTWATAPGVGLERAWPWFRRLGVALLPVHGQAGADVQMWRSLGEYYLERLASGLLELQALSEQRKTAQLLTRVNRQTSGQQSRDLAALEPSLRFEAAVALLLLRGGANVRPATLAEDLREQTDLWCQLGDKAQGWTRIQVSRSVDPAVLQRKQERALGHRAAVVTPLSLAKWWLKQAQQQHFDLADLFRWTGVVSGDQNVLARAIARDFEKWAVTL